MDLTKTSTLLVEIQGHTDSREHRRRRRRHRTLGRARANAVRDVLVRLGVAPGCLVARGYGAAVPLTTNGTREGRTTNRRVEFVIVKRR